VEPEKIIDFPTRGLSLEYYKDMILARSEDEMRVLSSAVKNGGLTTSRYILNMNVKWMYYSLTPEDEIDKYEKMLGIDGIVGMMTAADVAKASVRHVDGITVIVTAGASNAATPGEDIEMWHNGTINIIVISEDMLTDEAMANSIITITEAKTRVFTELDIRSVNSGNAATGTTTDSVAVATLGRGECLRYASAGTDFGRKMGKMVYECVLENILMNNGLNLSRPFTKRLLERRIDIKDHLNFINDLNGTYGMIDNSTIERSYENTINYIYVSGLKIIDEYNNDEEGEIDPFFDSIASMGRLMSDKLGGKEAIKLFDSKCSDQEVKDYFSKDPSIVLSLGICAGLMSSGDDG